MHAIELEKRAIHLLVEEGDILLLFLLFLPYWRLWSFRLHCLVAQHMLLHLNSFSLPYMWHAPCIPILYILCPLKYILCCLTSLPPLEYILVCCYLPSITFYRCLCLQQLWSVSGSMCLSTMACISFVRAAKFWCPVYPRFDQCDVSLLSHFNKS